MSVQWNEDRAREMIADGVSFAAAGVYFGLDGKTVKARLFPDYAKIRAQDAKRARGRKAGNEVIPSGARRVDTTIPKEELHARLREIPPDHRDLTGFMFGDPLPGRSALDQKRSQAA